MRKSVSEWYENENKKKSKDEKNNNNKGLVE
jgi:hypothetical protein